MGDYETLTETEWEQVNRIWDLLEDGDQDRARKGVDALLARRPGHPDLRIVEAAVCLDEGRADDAFQVLKGAERSADPALFFHMRALANYELVRFQPARADCERALTVHPDFAESHDLLARVLEHIGEDEEARNHAEEATGLDPEAFPPPLEIEDEAFDRLVETSLEELPDDVRRRLEELTIVVEPLPNAKLLTAEEPPLSPDILGLFVGSHLLEREHGDTPTTPAAIYLYRRNLMRACSDHEELAREVRTTVRHEVGHLLGLDEDDLEKWGLA